MSMALYDWTKFNPGVKLVSTKKKFFNQFYYSLKYHVPKCRIICYWSETNADTLRERVAWANDSNKYFYSSYTTQHANYSQLIDYLTSKFNFKIKKIQIQFLTLILFDSHE